MSHRNDRRREYGEKQAQIDVVGFVVLCDGKTEICEGGTRLSTGQSHIPDAAHTHVRSARFSYAGVRYHPCDRIRGRRAGPLRHLDHNAVHKHPCTSWAQDISSVCIEARRSRTRDISTGETGLMFTSMSGDITTITQFFLVAE